MFSSRHIDQSDMALRSYDQSPFTAHSSVGDRVDVQKCLQKWTSSARGLVAAVVNLISSAKTSVVD